MAVSKVIFGTNTIIDLTNDNITANALLSNYTAHGANGEIINGAIVSKAAATYTPSSVVQTIPSGVYLAGAQTISAIPSASGVNF